MHGHHISCEQMKALTSCGRQRVPQVGGPQVALKVVLPPLQPLARVVRCRVRWVQGTRLGHAGHGTRGVGR